MRLLVQLKVQLKQQFHAVKQHLIHLLSRINGNEIKKAKKEKAHKIKKPEDLKQKKDYFKTAKTWADDIYTSVIVSRNRYKVAFYLMSALVFVLGFCVLILAPMQHTELVIVHEGEGGYTWLSTTKQREKPTMNWARTQSEIAHYVMTRESYDPLMYRYQTHEVRLLSSPEVEAGYELAQSSDNKLSPINMLGAKGYRTVQIQSILPLDSESKNTDEQNQSNQHDLHTNLAQVNFVMVDHIFGQSQTIKMPYTALVSWTYTGVPSDPDDMMRNWDGFTVIKYDAQPKNIGNNDE